MSDLPVPSPDAEITDGELAYAKRLEAKGMTKDAAVAQALSERIGPWAVTAEEKPWLQSDYVTPEPDVERTNVDVDVDAAPRQSFPSQPVDADPKKAVHKPAKGVAEGEVDF